MSITKGTILIDDGTILPDSLLLNREPYSMNWTCASHLDGHGLEGQLRRIGWTLFYMAGDIKANAFGFDEEKRVNAAVSRVAKRVRAQNCKLPGDHSNGDEIFPRYTVRECRGPLASYSGQLPVPTSLITEVTGA